MPAIVSWEVETVGFVVRRDDDAADVPHCVLASILFVHSEHIRGRRRIDLHVIVEAESVDIAEVPSFAHSKNYGLGESVESTQEMRWRDLYEIPRADCVLHGLQNRVLPDTLQSSENEGVIQFLVRTLPAVCEPTRDVLIVVRIDALDMVDPWAGFAGISWYDLRRPVEIEAGATRPFNPPAICNEAIRNQSGLPWSPGDLLDWLVNIEPIGGFHSLDLAVIVASRVTSGIEHDHGRNEM
jgi:hypothetical protein